MRSLKTLLQETIENRFYSEMITEQLDVETLEEAINQFKELPHSWKVAVNKKKGVNDQDIAVGENSKILQIAQKQKFKSIDTAVRFVRKSIDLDEQAMVWIEINDTPVYCVYKTYLNRGKSEYHLLSAEGNYEKVSHYVRDRVYQQALGKMVKGTKELSQRAVQLQDVERFVYSYLYNFIKSLAGDSEDKPDEIIKNLNLNISVKGLGVDENRVSVSAGRKEARQDRGIADIENRKNVAIKNIQRKLGFQIDDIKRSVEMEVLKFEKGENFSFKDIEDKMKQVSYIFSIIESIKNDKRYSNFKYMFSWEKDKPRVNTDYEYALKAIKELESI